jgi:hypothetical protein
MTLEGLIAAFRVDAKDRGDPPLFDEEDVIAWLNEAQKEAAVRGRLLHESTNPEVCEIEVQVGVAVYPLHQCLYEIDYLGFQGGGEDRIYPVTLKSLGVLDREVPGWRTRAGRVEFAVQGDQALRLALKPSAAGMLRLEGYRLPLGKMDQHDDEPEIHRAHHRRLVDWALFLAFSVPDADVFDPVRANAAESAFTAYFGPRPDSDLRRTTRHDQEHHNVGYLA